MRVAGMVHGWAVVSISAHCASRTSPDRAAVSTRNSNARFTAGCAEPDARTGFDRAGNAPVRQRPPVRHDVVLRTEHPQHAAIDALTHRTLVVANLLGTLEAEIFPAPGFGSQL